MTELEYNDIMKKYIDELKTAQKINTRARILAYIALGISICSFILKVIFGI